jgi:hypothetical protein
LGVAPGTALIRGTTFCASGTSYFVDARLSTVVTFLSFELGPATTG